MVQELIVALIVGASACYAGRKYLPAKWIGRKQTAGCGSGCDTCGSCDSAPAAPAAADSRHPVIKLHSR